MPPTIEDRKARAMATSLGLAARLVLLGRETTFSERVFGREELRREGLLRASTCGERFTAFAKRVKTYIVID